MFVSKFLVLLGIILSLVLVFHFTTKETKTEPPKPAETVTAPAPETPKPEATMTTITEEINKELNELQGIMASTLGAAPSETIKTLDLLYKRAQNNAKDATLLVVKPEEDETRFTLARSAASLSAAIFEFKDCMETLKANGKMNNAQLDAAQSDLQKAKDYLKKVKI